MILRKIITIVATRYHILRLKCTKFDFSWDSAPDPARELTVLPQTPWLDLRDPTSKGRGGRGSGKVGRKGVGGEDEGKEGRGGDGVCIMALGRGVDALKSCPHSYF